LVSAYDPLGEGLSVLYLLFTRGIAKGLLKKVKLNSIESTLEIEQNIFMEYEHNLAEGNAEKVNRT
jgi:hypothetical protein